ncbi:hypothetical protein Pfo_002925 [Paulownia fortunei]|nr:hypothetical protein Pfo_002925 [Paulownia fortunei]
MALNDRKYSKTLGVFFRGMLLNWRFGFSDWFSLNQNNLDEGQAPIQEFRTTFLKEQYIFTLAAEVCYIQRGT